MKTFIVALLITVWVSGQVLAQLPKLTAVYVVDGAHRADLHLSTENVRMFLSANRAVQLVNKEKSAGITVAITDRGVGPTRFNERTKGGRYSGVELATAPVSERTYWLSAIARIGQTRKELLGVYTVTSEDAARTGWNTVESAVADEVVPLTAISETAYSRRRQ